jgi:DivIVA domain-containing protein
MNNLTPDQIRAIEFDRVRRNGYDADQVDRFVEAAASAIDRLTIELQQATKLMNAGEVGQAARVIAMAERVAAEAEAAATVRAEEIVAQGERDGEQAREVARQDAARIEAEANERGAEIVDIATAQAGEIKAAAYAEEADLLARNTATAAELASREGQLAAALERLTAIGQLAGELHGAVTDQLSTQS